MSLPGLTGLLTRRFAQHISPPPAARQMTIPTKEGDPDKRKETDMHNPTFAPTYEDAVRRCAEQTWKGRRMDDELAAAEEGSGVLRGARQAQRSGEQDRDDGGLRGLAARPWRRARRARGREGHGRRVGSGLGARRLGAAPGKEGEER